jgi:pyrroloquinoline-quinone synthase
VTEEFIARLRAQGARYHNLHPFHRRMDAGELTRDELQRWVANRFYYQKCIPLKDAAILAAVRYAVDAYVNFARQKPWVEAVASSLTELFGPAAIRVRLEALERHYRWIDPAGLEYFRARLVKAPRDAQYALDLTVERCRTPEQQDAAVAALRFKTEMLWVQLDAIERGDTQPAGPQA